MTLVRNRIFFQTFYADLCGEQQVILPFGGFYYTSNRWSTLCSLSKRYSSLRSPQLSLPLFLSFSVCNVQFLVTTAHARQIAFRRSSGELWQKQKQQTHLVFLTRWSRSCTLLLASQSHRRRNQSGRTTRSHFQRGRWELMNMINKRLHFYHTHYVSQWRL